MPLYVTIFRERRRPFRCSQLMNGRKHTNSAPYSPEYSIVLGRPVAVIATEPGALPTIPTIPPPKQIPRPKHVTILLQHRVDLLAACAHQRSSSASLSFQSIAIIVAATRRTRYCSISVERTVGCELVNDADEVPCAHKMPSGVAAGKTTGVKRRRLDNSAHAVPRKRLCHHALVRRGLFTVRCS
jgi:hypothetical protein